MRSYERFRAWQEAHALAIAVYRVTRSWPADERYGLVSQIRRAAFAVPANIAEGSARRGSRELRRFLDLSLGSLTELAYILRLAHDIGILDAAGFEELDSRRLKTGRLLWALYRFVAARTT